VALNGKHFRLSRAARLHVVGILDTAEPEELLCYLPQLVHYLRYEPLLTRAPTSPGDSDA
jgi:hypothetical protein